MVLKDFWGFRFFFFFLGLFGKIFSGSSNNSKFEWSSILRLELTRLELIRVSPNPVGVDLGLGLGLGLGCWEDKVKAAKAKLVGILFDFGFNHIFFFLGGDLIFLLMFC